jgi:hypothetical protein
MNDYGDGVMTSNNYDVAVIRIVMTIMGTEEQSMCQLFSLEFNC